MIVVAIRYLCGFAAATDPSTQAPEWPPHSGRVVMAMAAAHYETGGGPEERAALEWLEAVGRPPSIRAAEAYDRSRVETFVPVNDYHGGIVKRTKQPRSFHKCRPHEDTVFILWNSDPPAEIRAALGRICAKTTRLGHSSSLVQIWVVEPGEEPEPNWIPEWEHPERFMRTAEAGLMNHLDWAFNRDAIEEYYRLAESLATATGREKRALKNLVAERFPNGPPARRRPQVTNWQGYTQRSELRRVECSKSVGPFDANLIILARTEGPSLGLESTLQLTGALRNAVMSAAPQDSQPEWLTGHQPNGTPTLENHLAYFPLPYVGHQYADGHILGLAIAVPRAVVPDYLRRQLGPVIFDGETGQDRNIRLWRRGVWEWHLTLETRDRPPLTLQRETWTAPSRTWASLTPVVLHHYPKKSRPDDVGRILREAFDTAMLPQPEELWTGPISRVTGSGNARALPLFDAGPNGLCPYQTHVLARFAQPLTGPVLVGRGRFRGYGLFSPMPDERRLG